MGLAGLYELDMLRGDYRRAVAEIRRLETENTELRAKNASAIEILQKALRNWCSPISNWKLEAEQFLEGEK